MGVLVTGDVLPFALTIRDRDAQPVDAGNVQLLVTQPAADGVSEEVIEYNPVESTSPGVYDVDHPAPRAGRYVGKWIATGNNASADVQVFNVDDATSFAPLVGLTEAKEYLGKDPDDETDDEEIWRMCGTASERVEDATRLWHRCTVTEYLPPGRVLFLSNLPVVSLTSIVQVGSDGIDVTGFQVGSDGILQPLYGVWPWVQWPNTNQVAVTYVAGELVVPPRVRDAVLVTLLDMWQSQRGPAGLPLQGSSVSEGEFVAAAPGASELPAEAQAMLAKWLKDPAIA